MERPEQRELGHIDLAVAVEMEDPFTGRRVHGPSCRATVPEVRVVHQHPDPRVPAGEAMQYGGRLVRRTIVDDHELARRHGVQHVTNDVGDDIGNALVLVVDGHHDRERWLVHRLHACSGVPSTNHLAASTPIFTA